MGSSLSASNVTHNPSDFASPKDSKDDHSEWRSFDYIVVGGGAAGCVLANRLSSDKNKTVLLIEGGGDNKNVLFSRIPLGFAKLFQSKHEWNYHTEEERAAFRRRLYWPRGKLLGGSTSLNALVFQRTSPSDFDEWEQHHGAKGWSYQGLAPYFAKCETRFGDETSSTHGRSGPVHTRTVEQGRLSKAFSEACLALGIPAKPELSDHSVPFGVAPATIIVDPKGQRSSAAFAYLTPDVRQRPNLTIAVNTRVVRVLFSKSENATKPRAIGVELAQEGGKGSLWRVAAKAEVILSSGSIGTPQVLMLSGVGPGKHLSEHGIPVVKDLASVGQNLQDHCLAMVRFKAKQELTSDYLTSIVLATPALLEWLWKGTGALTSNGVDTLVFYRTVDSGLPLDGKASKLSIPRDRTSGASAPDAELVFAPMMLINHGIDRSPESGVTICAGILRPESVGQITLRSNRIWDHPRIEANYLSSENDLNTLTRAVRLAMRVGRSEPLRQYLIFDDKQKRSGPESEAKAISAEGAPEQALFWSGNVDPDTVTDEEIENFLHGSLQTMYHPVSTAKIARSEHEGVVDHNLRVFGVDGLRVVDASVFPTIPSGHTMAITLALAERASDLILGKLEA